MALVLESFKKCWHECCVTYKIDCEKAVEEREEMQNVRFA